MNKFYINGNQVAVEYAKARFFSFHSRVNGMESAEITEAWDACQTSEEERDNMLPDNLEIVQAA